MVGGRLRRGAAVFGVGLAAAGLALTLSAGKHATAPALAVVPFPGTPDASARSQITFTTLSPSQLRSVTVDGSDSGEHRGHLSALPDRRGTAFVPDRPFAAGEHVTVHANVSSPQAARAASGSSTRQLSFTFTVAITPRRHRAAAGADAVSPLVSTQAFHSRPDLRPPVVTVKTADADPNSGDVFLDAQQAAQNGPMILDGQGRLVWFHPLPGNELALDLRKQTYRGQSVLTYWQGQFVGGHGVGADVILDRSYRPIATVHAAEGYHADLHEFLLTPRGTALITAYEPIHADLSSVGGPRHGTVLDGIVQEIDVRTGGLLWEWHALGHVPLNASYNQRVQRGPYDFFHINSVQELPDGDLLISARDTWAVYLVSRRTGRILWQLGGKGSDFKMGAGTQFEWQHDVRMLPDGTVTMFDNADTPKEESQSRALELTLDTKDMTTKLARSYTHTPPVLAGSQGNLQLLPNGNAFVGWGSEPDFSEYTRSGEQIFSARWPRPVQSYRAYRAQWHARPADPPAVAVAAAPTGAVTAFASWNGATDVARWQLLAGPAPTDLSPAGDVAATGFETAIPAATTQPYLAARALDSSGQVLGTSPAIPR